MQHIYCTYILYVSEISVSCIFPYSVYLFIIFPYSVYSVIVQPKQLYEILYSTRLLSGFIVGIQVDKYNNHFSSIKLLLNYHIA